MLEQLQAYADSGLALKNQWLTYIDNKEIALASRWAAYLKAPVEWKKEITTSSVPYPSLEAIGIDSPYDDLNIDRRGTNTVERDVETITDYVGQDYRGIAISEEHVDQMKEDAIKKRLHAWKWDW